MKSNIIFISILFLLISCGSTTRGTSTDYNVILQNIDNCKDTLGTTDFVEKQDGVLSVEMVGSDQNCLLIEDSKFFYKGYTTASGVKSVLVRSFYALRGNKARLFLPSVHAYDVASGQLNEGIIDYLDDLNTSKDGQFLEVKYIFNHPVKHLLVITDRNYSGEQYEYEERNIGGTYSGGMFLEWDFMSNHNISINAGGPIEVILNPD